MTVACRKAADVLFLIDTTSNIDYEYFRYFMLGFVKDVIGLLDVDSGRTQVAAISYSDTAKVGRPCLLRKSTVALKDDIRSTLQQ